MEPSLNAEAQFINARPPSTEGNMADRDIAALALRRATGVESFFKGAGFFSLANVGT
jgi:alpha-D-ribose 1-methylphosphonate 5-triphosphate synthase subunit PhnI